MSQLTIQQTFEQALRHHQAGRLREAEQLYRQIIAQQPNHADAMHLLGALALQAGQYDIAVDLIRRAIALKPNIPEAHFNLGIALKGKGQLDEAIAAYRQAIALNPSFPTAHYNLGATLKDKGQLDEAIAAFRKAVALRPDLPETHCNLGMVLSDRGQLDNAIACYRQAIALNPNYAEAYGNLGNALREKGQFDQAATAYRHVITLRPNYAEAYNNLGIALKELGQLDKALTAFRQAIALRPNYANAYSNLGNALKEEGQLDEAIASYRKAMTLNPELADVHSNLVFALHYHSGYDAQAIAEELSRWNHQHAEPLRKFIETHSNNRDPGRPLRIGYISPDFRDHVVGQNLLPLFRLHDHRQFEITCYSDVLRPDAMTRLLEQNANRWRSIVGLSDDLTAKQIREDQIDILVDLAQHTSHNRLLVFARKPAPVQACYLAYCGSTGMSAMDYRLSDPYFDPADADLSCYSEKTLQLPRSYWCYQPVATPAPVPSPALNNGFVTFGCLNNFAKVSPAALDLWGRILTAVPDSRLILYMPLGNHRDAVAQRLEHACPELVEGAGVTNDRLLFVGKQPSIDYLQTYSRIDIALDPFPYGGGITSCDALWMGVPVITLSGQTAVGRGGRSILSNLGLTELIAFTQDQYAQIAIDLAKDRDRMDSLRRGMRDRILASPLIDAEGFARDMEAAYRQMWRTWCERSSTQG